MLIDAGSRKLKMLKPAWYQAIGKYAYSNLNKSLWQIIDTFVPYCVLWALMLSTVRQCILIGSLWRWHWRQEASGSAFLSFFTIAASLRRAGQTQSWAMSQVF